MSKAEYLVQMLIYPSLLHLSSLDVKHSAVSSWTSGLEHGPSTLMHSDCYYKYTYFLSCTLGEFTLMDCIITSYYLCTCQGKNFTNFSSGCFTYRLPFLWPSWIN